MYGIFMESVVIFKNYVGGRYLFVLFLLALLDSETPPAKVTVVLGGGESAAELPLKLPPDAAVTLLQKPTEERPLVEGKTTFYVCKGHSCLLPVNHLDEITSPLFPA